MPQLNLPCPACGTQISQYIDCINHVDGGVLEFMQVQLVQIRCNHCKYSVNFDFYSELIALYNKAWAKFNHKEQILKIRHSEKTRLERKQERQYVMSEEKLSTDVTNIKTYKAHTEEVITLVNENKVLEENILQTLDVLAANENVDKRWLAIGRTSIEQAFMAINRSIFKPERLKKPEVI